MNRTMKLSIVIINLGLGWFVSYTGGNNIPSLLVAIGFLISLGNWRRKGNE